MAGAEITQVESAKKVITKPAPVAIALVEKPLEHHIIEARQASHINQEIISLFNDIHAGYSSIEALGSFSISNPRTLLLTPLIRATTLLF